MAFDNHYPNRKDRRKPYKGSKAFDRSCRPGGDCPYCRNGEQHPTNTADVDFKEQLDEQDER